MARETLQGTNYVLRPIHDEMLDEFGSPPMGYPEECWFKWPDKPLTIVTPKSSKARYIYVSASADVDLRELDDDVVVMRMPDNSSDSDESEVADDADGEDG